MSSPRTRPHPKQPPPARLAEALDRHAAEIIETWSHRIRASSEGKRLVRGMGDANLEDTLSRTLAALRRSLSGPASNFVPSALSAFNDLLAKDVNPVWLARWCVALFDICRDVLDGDHRIAPRELITLRNTLLGSQERIQGALLDHAGRMATRGAVARLEETLESRTQELRSARDRYRDLVERLDDVIFTLDPKGRFESVSGRGLKALGLTEADLVGKRITAVTPARYCREVKNLRRRLVKKKRLRGVTIRTLDPKGKEIIIEITASLLEREGKAESVLGVARDVTSRIRLEEKVRETKEYLELLVESSVDGIIATDENGDITLFSRGAEEIFGYKSSEVLHKSVGAFFALPEDGGASLFKLIEESAGRLQNRECVCRRRDGREVVVSYSASFLHNEAAAVIGMIGVCKDITDRRRAEENIRRKNEELETYARTVSHDLRGPLVSIHGFSSLLEETCGDRFTESGRYFLDRIRENALTMGRLISDVLEFSTAGKNTGTPYWVSVGPLLENIAEELGPQLTKSAVRLEIQRPMPQILADETRLRQVFSNLITNALDHIGNTKNPVIEVRAEPDERGHILCVADNGRGMPPELQNRIFDLFFTRRPAGGGNGSGLGLAIVKKTVEAFGGRVWVESEPDRGARFYLYFPDTKW